MRHGLPLFLMKDKEMHKSIVIASTALLVLLLPRHGYPQNEEIRGKVLWGGTVLGGGLFEHDGNGADGDQSSRETKPGFVVGGYLSYGLHERLALHAEVLFARKGSHHLLLGQRIGSYTLNYLELPLLARVSLLPLKGRLSSFVTVGPMLGIMLSASGEDVRMGEPLDVEGVWKTFDFGVVMGMGAAMQITPYDLLGLEARYDMGLRAIEHDRDTINNRGILFMLRYETCICSRSD